MKKRKKTQRIIALFFLVQITTQVFFPAVCFALTSGPKQPEFSSFEPAATTNMVDEFSGDFTYNLPVLEVPGPDGSSYPVTLSYHSGITSEEESSWVGYGWTLNAGAVNRSTSGLPDDFKGNKVNYYNRTPRNWTASTGGSITCCEMFSVDVRLGLNATLRYNNYRGFGYNVGAGMYLGRGVVALGYSVDDGQGSFSLSLNPTAALNYALHKHADNVRETAKSIRSSDPMTSASLRAAANKIDRMRVSKGSGSSIGIAGSKYGIFSYNEFAKPTTVSSYSGSSYNITFGLQGNVSPAPIGVTATMYASFSSQVNDGVTSPAGFGYLYNSSATSTDVMDYHVEKETDFNKRDVFLGVPFNDADNFMVTGEGIGGGFRLFNKRSGHYGPRTISSGITIYNVGYDVDAGWTFGPGVDLGLGRQSVDIKDWNKGLSSFASPTDVAVDEPVFFRFNNDLGGEWGSNHDDKPVQASVSGSDLSPLGTKDLSLDPNLFSYNNGERSGRSSYVSYNTVKDMLESNSTTPTYVSFNKNPFINTLAGRGATANPKTADLIGEIAVINEGGMRYLYALPIFNQNERQLSYSVEGASVSNIENKFIVYNTKDEKVKVGYEQPDKYASTYLLTEINTPDYIDKLKDGGTPDDLGGYTRFNYVKLDGWYNWRTPYRGLMYNKNSHSDPRDDQGSYSEGEKEICYLQSIETKTHVAVFITSDRTDSKEASDTPLSKTGTPGTMNLQQLDKIELYVISDCNRDVNGNQIPISGRKPIKRVHFTYKDNSDPLIERLCKGQPNAADQTVGKLTLERVYFEYNGIVQAKISPYQFSYSYPTPSEYLTYPAKYNSGAEDVTANFNTLSASSQNPDYTEFNSDAWGNYQINGQTRFDKLQTWLDQTQRPNIDFDPAPWHLKVITLPSGGQIHVQYEQDDYSYVQDQQANVMAPLLDTSSPENGFFINTAAIGVTDLAGKQWLVDNIVKHYKEKGNKIYFKFLYSLLGNVTPNLDICNADFITGYASVADCSLVNDEVFVSIAGRLPKDVCKEFVKTQRLGLLDPLGNCTPGLNEAASGDEKEKAIAAVRQLAGMIDGVIIEPNNLCKQISPQDSYLRVPTPIAKKGGGVRVKRLLMFDKAAGLDSGPVLYGNEYLYKTVENGRVISSGVATNEPQSIREENVLVDFVARKGQDLWSKIIAGKDKKQAEGPIGESILPGASVGYSKVIIRNIHSGKTNPGFSINEFYTAKDYPLALANPNKPGTMTSINAPSPQKRFLYGVIVNVFIDKSWATQGFSFVVNNMHGQIRSASTYTGPSDDVITLAKSTLVSRMGYEYYKPGEKVPVVSSLFGDITLKNPGREVDITFAQKKVIERSYDVNVEADIELSFVPPFITLFYPTAIPSVSFTEGALFTHATTKVIRYPAILKKTTVYQDGILHTEENVAFDQWTGKPVVVKSLDEFKGAYLSNSIPASWQYPNYTAKYATEGMYLKPSSTPFSYTETPTPQLQFSNDGCAVLSKIVTGDVLELGTNALFQVQKIDYSRDKVDLARVSGYTGTPSSSIVMVKIVRSGRTNELSESAGDMTLHNANADNLNAASMRQPDSQRFIASGTDATDGSLFVKDLNTAYANPGAVLQGPYYHMNLTQYGGQLPAGCSADLSDATVRNVNMLFKTTGATVQVELGTFEILCGGTWQLVKTPN